MSDTRLHTGTFSLAKGTRLNGIYEIDNFLASGGMGDIYKGHSIETGDVVAIKLMRHELVENTAALALFRKEASALHHLYHEAIVRYFVFTVEPELKRPYLAMEYVEGEPLSTILKEGPLAYEAAFDLKNRLAQALQVAHQVGIIHRDVSPDNVLVPSRDVRKAKIIDFGIARSTLLHNTETVIGSGFAGKYSYVSPEQLGMFGGEVTARSDIYSLGLVLAEAVTGQQIDMGSNHFESIERRRVVPDLGAVDARLRPLLEKMLRPEPSSRIASMLEVVSEPAIGMKHAPGEVARTTARKASQFQRSPGRKKAAIRLGFAAVGLGILGAGAAGVYLSLPSETHIRPPPELPGYPTSTTETKADVPGNSKMPPSATASKEKEWAAFIHRYDGGECFFLLPLALQSPKPKIDGFGASVAPFVAFDAAFTSANKLDADVGVHQVTAAQCPAITFLYRMRAEVSAGPKIELENSKLRAGESLRGTLQNLGSRYPIVLLISETGSVHNLTNFLRPEGELRTFSIPLPTVGSPGEQPQLLLALAASQPFDLHAAGVFEAAPFFSQLLADFEHQHEQVGVTARYFKIQR